MSAQRETLSTNERDEGMSLAAAATLANELMLGRSFRLHRPRGAFCHSGWCQQCKVQLNDGSVVLACETRDVGAGGWKRPRPFLRLIGWIAEYFPPWFHEHRFLKPHALRQTYLAILRRLSGALPLPREANASEPRSWTTRACRTLVVGGGLSGLAAAAELARAGHDVTLVEAGRLGGSARTMPALQEEIAARRTTLEQAGGTALEETTVVGLYEQGTVALCSTRTGTLSIAFKELVVATGAYDRLLTVPGNDLPGVIGVRAFERLACQGAIARGARVGVYAAAAEADRAIAAAAWIDHPLAWVLQPSERGARLQAVIGSGRVASAQFENGERRACDLLVLGFSQPTYELQAQMGQTITFSGTGSPFGVTGPTVAPTLVVGEAAGSPHPAAAAKDAEAAVRAWLEHSVPARGSASDSVAPFTRLNDAAMLCPCEDVRVGDVRRAIAGGFDNVELAKRRTGAGTGPCQGKLCHHALLSCLAEAGLPIALPTVRPLVRPVKLSAFVGDSDD